jgi:NADH:ubiquinone oxidoreductase subunit 5 (subunit L)/multisubunit Na+/H+ antiporter MnhA subunit
MLTFLFHLGCQQRWLPHSPASVLVNFSTLVTAGVYLLILFSPFLLFVDLYIILLLVSELTIFIAAVKGEF